MLRHPMRCLNMSLEEKVDQVEVMSSMIVPVIPAFHTKGNSSRRWIGTRVLAGGVPSSVLGSQRLMSKDMMLESTASEVLVVFKRHDDDGSYSWTTNFFYLPRSRTTLKSGLILSYFPNWLIIRWFHFFRCCLFSLVWLYLSPKCIYT